MRKKWFVALALALLTSSCASAPPAGQDGADDDTAQESEQTEAVEQPDKEASATEEVTEATEPTTAVSPGRFEGTLDATAIEHGDVRLAVRDDYSMVGAVRGKIGGQAFMIPLMGGIDKSTGEFTIEGSRGDDTAKLEGTIEDNGAKGVMTATIAGQQVESTFDIQ